MADQKDNQEVSYIDDAYVPLLNAEFHMDGKMMPSNHPCAFNGKTTMVPMSPEEFSKLIQRPMGLDPEKDERDTEFLQRMDEEVNFIEPGLRVRDDRVEMPYSYEAWVKAYLMSQAKHMTLVLPSACLTYDPANLFSLAMEDGRQNETAKAITGILSILCLILGFEVASKTKKDAPLCYRGEIPLDKKLDGQRKKNKGDDDEEGNAEEVGEIPPFPPVQEPTDASDAGSVALSQTSSKRMRRVSRGSPRALLDDNSSQVSRDDAAESVIMSLNSQDDRPAVPHPPLAPVSDSTTMPPPPGRKGKYLLRGELEKILGEEFKVTGENWNNRKFCVRRKQPNGKWGEDITLDRFVIDVEYIHIREQEDESDLWKFSQPECMIFHFYIIDPRMCVVKGLDRLFRSNALDLKKAGFKDRGKTNTSTKVADIETVEDARFDLQALKINNWKAWAEMLAAVSTKPNLTQDMWMTPRLSAAANEKSLLDPCMALNPQRLFADGFSYTALCNERKGSVWTDEDFRSNVAVNYTDNRNRKEVVFYLPRSGVDYVTEGMFKAEEGMLITRGDFQFLQTEFSYLFYINAHRTIRLPMDSVGAVLVLAMMFPWKMDTLGEKERYPTPEIPFWVNSVPVKANRESRISLVESGLYDFNSTPWTKGINKPAECDLIFRQHFGSVTRTLASNTLAAKFAHETIGDVRARLFSIACDRFSQLNANLSETHRRMAGLGPSLGTDYFPSVYSDAYQFKAYSNLTAYGNFLVNFSDIYVDGPSMSMPQNHGVVMMIITMTAWAVRMRLGLQAFLIVMGDKASGKSTMFSKLQSLFSLVYCEVNQETAKNITANGKEPRISLCDDADSLNPHLSPNETVGGSHRTVISEGCMTHEALVITASNHRLTVPYHVWMRLATFISTNILSLKDTTKSRAITVFFPALDARKNQRDNTGFSNKAAEEALQLQALCNSFLAFSAEIGFLVASGAMTYNVSENTVVSSLLMQMVTRHEMFELLNGKLDSRDFIEKVNGMVYSVSVHRLWAQILSGVYDDPDLRPGARRNKATFMKIEMMGLLMATEEDAMVALSYFDKMFPTSASVDIVEWMVSVSRQRGYIPGEGTAVIHRCPHFMQKESRSKHVERISPFEERVQKKAVQLHLPHHSSSSSSSTANFYASEIQEKKAFAKAHNVEYIDSGIDMDLTSLSRSIKPPPPNTPMDPGNALAVVISKFCGGHSSSVDVHNTLVSWLSPNHYEYVPLVWTETQYGDYVLVCPKSSTYAGVNFQDKVTTVQGPIILAKKSMQSQITSRIYFNRNFLDRACLASPYFREPVCKTNSAFKSSPLRQMVMDYEYPHQMLAALNKGCVLPGMSFARPLNLQTGQELPQVFDVYAPSVCNLKSKALRVHSTEEGNPESYYSEEGLLPYECVYYYEVMERHIMQMRMDPTTLRKEDEATLQRIVDELFTKTSPSARETSFEKNLPEDRWRKMVGPSGHEITPTYPGARIANKTKQNKTTVAPVVVTSRLQNLGRRLNGLATGASSQTSI